MPVTINKGFVTHHNDSPLKAKCVATIGSPKSYLPGVVGLAGQPLVRTQKSYAALAREFYMNGVDVIRLNLSHLERGQIGPALWEIKDSLLLCEEQFSERKPIAILADLPGPKIRFQLEAPLKLKTGKEFHVLLESEEQAADAATAFVDGKPFRQAMDALDTANQGLKAISGKVSNEDFENVLDGFLRHPEAPRRAFEEVLFEIQRQITEGRRPLALIGDGDAVLEVTDVAETCLVCSVLSVAGGTFRGNKGFTIKGVHLNIPTFTSTDRAKLEELLIADCYDRSEAAQIEAGRLGSNPLPSASPVQLVAYIGLSFTQTANDVLNARHFVEGLLGQVFGKDRIRIRSPWIIAKVETEKGCQNIDYILDVADGLMIARGDLGLQMDSERVPALQKYLAELSRMRGKPVIVATGMLNSMTRSLEPSRAEASDVYNAILDGADAVMTSDETSRGRHPLQAIRKMLSIAAEAESSLDRRPTSLAGQDLPDTRRRELKRQEQQDFLRDDFSRIAQNEKRIRRLSRILGRLATRTQGLDPSIRDRLLWGRDLYREKLRKASQQDTTNRITEAACQMAESEATEAIVAASTTGRTVTMVARMRPSPIIVGAAHVKSVFRKLTIVYGTFPLLIRPAASLSDIEGLFIDCQYNILKSPYLSLILGPRDRVVFMAGAPLGRPGTTNLVNMRELKAIKG